jgi:hypothetical protein
MSLEPIYQFAVRQVLVHCQYVFSGEKHTIRALPDVHPGE